VELGAEFLSLEELGRRMIPVSPHTVARNAGPAGGPFANAAASPVTVPGFTIAATEVPYQLWYTVRTWAEHEDRGSGRYSFPKDAGKEGSADGSGNWIALPTSRHNYNPVVAVSWQDALVWCNAYSDWAREVRGENTWPVYRHNGVVLRNPAVATAASPDVPALNAPAYRLPTEAEWEYAARGGDPGAEAWDYPYAGGVEEDRVAWHRGNAEGSTHQVGLKDPNTLGLYDMSGNAEEWCWDFHSGTSRVLRGGRFDQDRIDISLKNARRGQSQSSSANRPGFRVVRPLD
jgi:formylglycine-generating enzyme required for sulfatase activity